MSISLNINTNKCLSIPGGVILENIRAIRDQYDKSLDVNCRFDLVGTDATRLECYREGRAPFLIIEFYSHERRLILTCSNTTLLTQVKGLFGPIPAKDMARLLKQSSFQQGNKYLLVSLDATYELTVDGEHHDFQSHIFGETDFFEDSYKQNREEIARAMYLKLEYPETNDFNHWLTTVRTRDGLFSNYLAVIEKQYPGFTMSLKYQQGQIALRYKLQRQSRLKHDISVLSEILSDETLSPVFNVGMFVRQQVERLYSEAKAIDFDVDWPDNVHPIIRDPLVEAIEYEKTMQNRRETAVDMLTDNA